MDITYRRAQAHPLLSSLLFFARALAAGARKSGEADDAIERMIQNHGTSIKRLCLMYLKDAGYAEEAAQDVFVKAYFKMHLLHDQTSEKAWLTKIAINTCKDYLRKRLLRMRGQVSSLEALPVEPSAASEDMELTEAIFSLEPIYKDVILMYYYRGLRINEIAGALHCSHTTVWRRLEKAEVLIRAYLEEG